MSKLDQKGLIHLLPLLVIVGIIGFILVSNTFSFRDILFNTLFPKPSSQARESQIELYTNQLVQRNDQLKAIQGTASSSGTLSADVSYVIEDMQDIAEKRKQALLEELESSPTKFLELVTLAKQRESFPSQIRDNLEQETQIQGKLEVIHKDDFEDKKSTEEFKVKVSDQKKYELYFASKPFKGVLTGATVQATGISLDSNLVVPAVNNAFQISDQVVPNSVTQARVAMILVRYQDNSQIPFSREQARDVLFAPSGSVKKYYEETSYTKLSFSGEVFGWYTLPISKSDPITACSADLLFNSAISAARNAGVNLDSYNYIGIVNSDFIPHPNCGAFAELGGFRSWYLTGDNFIRIYIHELGHNFYNHHANLLHECAQPNVYNFANCTSLEYGDLYDAMGAHSEGYFNVPHRIGSGWMMASGVREVTTSGNYTITPHEINNGGPFALKISKPDTANYYFVEYRQPIGFDANLYTHNNIFNGVSVIMWDGASFTPTNRVTRDALTDGAEFYDQVNSIKIKQISHNSNSATVAVTLSGSPSVQAVLDSPELELPPMGVSIRVLWDKVPNPTKLDWIGLYQVGEKDNGKYKVWAYTHDLGISGVCNQQPGDAKSSGSCGLFLPGNIPSGNYELRFLANNGLNVTATSSSFKIIGYKHLSVVPGSIPPGGNLTVKWSSLPGNTNQDWVGFYKKGQVGAGGWVDWIYINSCKKDIPSSSLVTGSCEYKTDSSKYPPGEYVARLFSNNGNNQIGEDTSFVVTGPTLQIGEGGSSNIIVTWNSINSPTTSDWVGFYPQGVTGAAGWVDWVYLTQSNCSKGKPTTAQSSGSCSYPIDRSKFSPGTYNAKLLYNNGNTILSQTIFTIK